MQDDANVKYLVLIIITVYIYLYIYIYILYSIYTIHPVIIAGRRVLPAC